MKEEYYAGALYVVRPSKIVDITGNITKSKMRDTNYVKQIAIFERQLRPTIAFKSTLNGFYDLFNKDNENNKLRKYYYDALDLKKIGITTDDKSRYFYNVFSGDKVLLSDYLFGYDCKTLISKIKFLKEPFSLDNMALKPEKSRELLIAKIFYTKEELQDIYENIQKHLLEQMESIKSYKVVKQPIKTIPTSSMYINKGPSYAGTNDDIDIKRQKTLEFFQK